MAIRILLVDDHVIVQDVHMPGMSGVALARRLATDVPHARVLALHPDAVIVSAMLNAGAYGYILKDDVYAELTLGIRAVCLSPPAMPSQMQASLTEREREQARPLNALQRAIDLAEVVDATLFAASPRAGAMTGSTLDVSATVR